MRILHLLTSRAGMCSLLACLTGISATTQAATYYVNNNGTLGDDTRTPAQATNIATPWKTIQKAATNMVAGDICSIRAGTYRETVTPANSGTSPSLPITFQAYGSETVILNGADPITGWVLESANVYYAPMTGSLGDGNQVFQSGVMKPEARWPNAGASFPWQDSSIKPSSDWSYVDSASYTAGANGTIVDAQLPARANGYWIGATVHAMGGYGWIMQFPTVTAYTDSTKTLVTNDAMGNSPAYALATGNEFYLTNGKKTEMDANGEWVYDTALSRLYFRSTTTPTNIEAKKRPYGFNLSSRSYIKLVKLRFNACTIQSNSGTTFATYDGLNMKFLNHHRKNSTSWGISLANGSVLKNSELAWDSQGLLQLAGSNIRVFNNNLHDSGYVPTWTAMADAGINKVAPLSYLGNLISGNTMQSAGRAIMGFPGRASIVEYNNFYNAMRLTTDGSVYYANFEAGNNIIRYNLLHDSPGPAGHTGAPVQGFYLDSQSTNWIVHHNIIWNIPGYAMQINARHNFNMVFNNTCRSATAGSIVTSFDSDGQTGTHIYNNLFNGPPLGNQATWAETDLRYNLHTDPLFVSGTSNLQSTSPAINQGTLIPGITDGYSGGAPDIGALEYGGTDWTPLAGHDLTPPAEPTYSMPTMIFANKVKEGSFENGALLPNWTLTGSSAIMQTGHSWTPGFNPLRTGGCGVKFTQGTSEIKQTVTGLQSGKRYRLFAGTQTLDPNAVVKIGVRNYGYGTLEITVPAASTWRMDNLFFITSPTSTLAEIYISVNSTSGTIPVYVDDVGVELSQDPSANPILAMPAYHLPFNETTGGTTAYDATTNARNGTISGGATWVAGVTGNALNFDGSNDLVSVPGAVPATSLGSFTVSTWVKFNNLGTVTNYSTLLSNNAGAWNVKGWQIKVTKVSPATNYTVGFYLWSGTQTGNVWLSTLIPPNQWAHVSFVVDRTAGTLKGYLNGIASINGTIPAGFTNADTALGTQVGSTTFAGQLDDVRVDDYALNTDQMAAVVGADPTKLVQLELNEPAGATKAWDASGNARNGTLNNFNTATAWSGDALRFDGVDDYVLSPGPVPVTPTGSFTLSAWVKFDNLGTPTNYSTLLSNNNGAWAMKGWQIKVTKVTPATVYTVGIYLWSQDQGSTPPPGTQASTWLTPTVPHSTWTHVAFVIDRPNGTVKGYLNGVLSSTGTIPAAFTNMDTVLGTRVGSNTFAGQLDDVRIYSRVLPWNEILDLAVPGDGPPY